MDRHLSTQYQSKLKRVNIAGVNEVAWDLYLLMDFLDDKESDFYAILGVDVLIKTNDNEMSYTYDQCSIDSRRNGESFTEFCKRSKVYILEYLNSYPTTDKHMFILIMTTEITAGF